MEKPGYFHCIGHKRWSKESNRSAIWPNLCLFCSSRLINTGLEIVDDRIRLVCPDCGDETLLSVRHVLKFLPVDMRCGPCAKKRYGYYFSAPSFDDEAFDFEEERCKDYGTKCLSCKHEPACLESMNFEPHLEFFV